MKTEVILVQSVLTLEDKSLIKPNIIFATLDKIEKIDDKHFRLEFYKYSKLDTVLNNLQSWKGKDIKIYITDIIRPEMDDQKRIRSKDLIKIESTKSKSTSLDGVFWDIPYQLEE